MKDLRVRPADLPAGQRGKRVQFTYNGEAQEGLEGEPIAYALYAAGVRSFAAHVPGSPTRSLFCGIGHCFGCIVAVDGQHGRRACLVPLQEGLRVTGDDQDGR